MTVSTETVRMVKSRPRKNQSERSDLPCHIIIALLYITQFGNKVGAGAFQGRAVPTYIYPDPIKTVVREVIDGELGDYPDPEGPAVSINSFLTFISQYFALCMYPNTKTNVSCHPTFQCSASPEQNILK